jgi:hypothetical protein
MASPIDAALCALLATAFWSLLGYALSRRVLPRPLAAGTAPVLGWAVHSAATLPLFGLIGFSATAVVVVAALCALAAGASFLYATDRSAEPAPAIPWWAFVAAAALALAPAAAILPKFYPQGVALADPILDHSKIAMIDAIARQGLPPVNPALGVAGVADHLPYYYLWHYSAAELSLLLRVSGWNADVALTWFTAFASLSLMMGLAVLLGRRASAAIWAVALAAAASMRMPLSFIVGSYTFEPVLAPPTGFAGWLFQSAWAPQHLMSAACVVTAMLLIVRYAERRRLATLAVLALVVAAGFESSTWIGGITFAIAALVATPVLLAGSDPARRVGLLAGLAVAAAVAVAFAAPFLREQFGAVAAHGGGSPVVVRPFEVLGDFFPAAMRRVLDLPAYWLVLLPLEFPAVYPAGILAVAALLRGASNKPDRLCVATLACLAGTGLVASWLLASTLGDNNDLALRAVLPALWVLIAAAAAGVALVPRRALIAATAIGGFVLGLPDAVLLVRGYATGTLQGDGAVFAQTPELWRAVRRYAPSGARVANNPLYLQDLTPWPGNMSWALLADRSSCFAGRELVLALAPVSAGEREAINATFIRVFSGEGTAQDVADMARRYRCDVVVVTPQDKAWNNDPFAANADYRLAESRDGQWRIYIRR